MQINMLGRAEGKTYNATFVASQTQLPILGVNKGHSKNVELKAQEMGLNKEQYPKTYDIQSLKNIHPDKMTDCIIDEVGMVLAALLRPYNLNPVLGYDSPPATTYRGYMIDKIIKDIEDKEE